MQLAYDLLELASLQHTVVVAYTASITIAGASTIDVDDFVGRLGETELPPVFTILGFNVATSSDGNTEQVVIALEGIDGTSVVTADDQNTVVWNWQSGDKANAMPPDLMAGIGNGALSTMLRPAAQRNGGSWCTYAQTKAGAPSRKGITRVRIYAETNGNGGANYSANMIVACQRVPGRNLDTNKIAAPNLVRGYSG